MRDPAHIHELCQAMVKASGHTFGPNGYISHNDHRSPGRDAAILAGRRGDVEEVKKMNIDYRELLCRIVEECFEGEITIGRNAPKRRHILHFAEDEDENTITIMSGLERSKEEELARMRRMNDI